MTLWPHMPARFVLLTMLFSVEAGLAQDDLQLPIDLTEVTSKFEKSSPRPQTLLPLEAVAAAVRSHPAGCAIEFPKQVTLLDGTVVAGSDIHGSVLTGPWPFASQGGRLRVKRFYRKDSDVPGGPIKLKDFFSNTTTNSEGWGPGSQGRFVLRMHLSTVIREMDEQGNQSSTVKKLGIFDTALTVRLEEDGTFTKLPTILEGPAINLVTSDHPDRVVVSLVSDVNKAATVRLGNGRSIQGQAPKRMASNWYRHEITVDGLKPDTKYSYSVQIGETRSEEISFQSAPPKGADGFRFAFMGDSRAGVGNSMTNVSAVNVDSMERLCGVAASQKVDLVLFGGDFSTGYTQVVEDFRTQLRVFKQSTDGVSGFIPFFTIPGNHEALMRTWSDGTTKYGLSFDRWPYETDSAEAVFADEFVNPSNGPQPRPRFPPYAETVYSFQYGCVRFIGFNTNYWMEGDTPLDGSLINQKTKLYGGCPEGYVMAEQLKWIEANINAAEQDETVQHIVLFAHEPMFPNGKHTADAMWYHGDNNSRAYVFAEGKVRPEPLGVIEVRNTLARLISRSEKVACVVNSDEHAFYRTLITADVPAGSVSDINPETGRIDWPNAAISPIPGLKRATWYIVSGGGGAPYSAELTSPWNMYWKKHTPNTGYYYTPQENILVFEVKGGRVSLSAFNAFGERIDRVKDLTAVRKVAVE